MERKKLALFASGSGTNAQNIMKYFADNETLIIDSLWSNNPTAFALQRAEKYGVDTFTFSRDELRNTDIVLSKLKERGVEFIVLAGFLWLIPESLLQNFTIINIHPALLPKYGGKGMFGMRVHEAVVNNKESETGITIHYVNEKYDEGELIFQAKCKVLSNDTPEDVAQKVHQLEYKHFPRVIEEVILAQSKKNTSFEE
ncbi:MAG: phosphoribosylglycinamide formyltransferase [Prolixibacteraceae bacterium]|nr:phosphoribosylglycinamide formyltransferase [Prolixibacteraceae bacterium]